MEGRKRCRLNKKGRETLYGGLTAARLPSLIDREGDFLGYVRNKPESAKVRWDGRKNTETIHSDFIEVIQ